MTRVFSGERDHNPTSTLAHTCTRLIQQMDNIVSSQSCSSHVTHIPMSLSHNEELAHSVVAVNSHV